MRALGDGTDNLALSLGKQMLFLGINGTYLRRRNNHVQGGCQFAGSCLDLAFVHTAYALTQHFQGAVVGEHPASTRPGPVSLFVYRGCPSTE